MMSLCARSDDSSLSDQLKKMKIKPLHSSRPQDQEDDFAAAGSLFEQMKKKKMKMKMKLLNSSSPGDDFASAAGSLSDQLQEMKPFNSSRPQGQGDDFAAAGSLSDQLQEMKPLNSSRPQGQGDDFAAACSFFEQMEKKKMKMKPLNSSSQADDFAAAAAGDSSKLSKPGLKRRVPSEAAALDRIDEPHKHDIRPYSFKKPTKRQEEEDEEEALKKRIAALGLTEEQEKELWILAHCVNPDECSYHMRDDFDGLEVF